MKNKKGFTLIELLAIIVILAIIAVITVPIILNIIENSKKGAISDSAYGFKDAVNKAYITKLSENPDYNIPDGTYTVSDLKTQIGLLLNGKEPSSDSSVTITKNNITTGCLQYDEYKVEFTDGKVTNTEKGSCSSESQLLAVYTDSDNSSTISLGDFVTIGEEGFYVVGIDGTTVKLITQYYLDSNSRQSADTPYLNVFASSKYWDTGTYNNDSYGIKYVYRDSNNEDTSNNFYTYINNYKDYLSNEVGLKTVQDVRMMSYEEAQENGCSSLNNSCPDYMSNKPFLLGSYNGSLYYYELMFYCGTNIGNFVLTQQTQIRPIVVIDASELVKYNAINFVYYNNETVQELVISGKTINLSSNYAGFNVSGWYDNSQYTNQISNSVVPTQNTSYYAKKGDLILAHVDNDNNGTISMGDTIQLGTDEFYVISNDANNTKLLAKHCLNSNDRQSEISNLYNFTNSAYWSSGTYNTDLYEKQYVYRDSSNADTQNNIYNHINNYKNYLTNNLEIDEVVDARLISYEEIRGTGCTSASNSCQAFAGANDHTYWTGSAEDSSNVWIVGSSLYNSGVSNTYEYIRPLVIVNSSILSNLN